MRYLTCFLLLFFSVDIFAWDATGHIIIADIAYQQLTKTAKADVNALFKQSHFAKNFPQFNTYVYSAPWPDYLIYVVKPPAGESADIFSFLKENTRPWHFSDDPVYDHARKKLKDINSVENSVWAVDYLIPQLQKELAEKKYEMATYDLIFITHIIGDIHQPLHSATLVNAQFPAGDRGGNEYTIQPYQGIGELHALWDDSFGRFKSWRQYSPNPSYRPPMARVTATATQFLALCGDQTHTGNDPQKWEQQAHNIAANFVYPIKNANAPQFNGQVSQAYVTAGEKIAATQMCRAGKRLANVLNKIFVKKIAFK